MFRVDYDRIAPEYNRRYESPELEGRARVLLDLAHRLHARRILEAGCGTGHWLDRLGAAGSLLFGLDYSPGMLRQARELEPLPGLVRATADELPFAGKSFDLVYCVDAIHHFPSPARFVAQALDCLAPGGGLAVIGLDPHNSKNSWYAYDYFEGMLETDLKRFPAFETLQGWMETAGFEGVSIRQVEGLDGTLSGRAVLDDPYLKKNSSSQMALLKEATYQAGLARLQADLAWAESRGANLLFRTKLCMDCITGNRPE